MTKKRTTSNATQNTTTRARNTSNASPGNPPKRRVKRDAAGGDVTGSSGGGMIGLEASNRFPTGASEGLSEVPRGILPRAMTADPLAPPMDLDEAVEFSRYAARLLSSQPGLAEVARFALERPRAWDEDELEALERLDDPATLAVELRRLRQRVMLGVLLRDLTGRADLAEVCAATTRLAEAAIGAAISVHHRRLVSAFGEPIGADSG